MTSLDGTVFDVPDSGANAAAEAVRCGPRGSVSAGAAAGPGRVRHCGRHRGGLRFPRLPARTLARRLLPLIEKGTLLLADRGFPSFGLFTAAAARGAELLWRVSASFTLPVDQVLSDGTYLSHLNGPHGRRVTVRVIEYTVHTTSDSGDAESSELFCLITTLLDPAAAPAEELAELEVYSRGFTSPSTRRAG
ncbi:IS4 family transposase, partial [Streptomyces sp. NPDC001817]